MANFKEAYELTLGHEGGYVKAEDDLAGGETYKGVARKMQPKWEGWIVIDAMKKKPNFPQNLDGNIQLQEAIELFYRINFWDTIKGDSINNQIVANSIFDFGVNAGTGTSVTLAQKVVGTTADGKIGPNTLNAINNFDASSFIDKFTIEKIKRYRDICLKKPEQKKFFFGWVVRALK